MLFDIFTLLFVCCCLMGNSSVNGGNSLEPLIKKANIFDKNTLRELLGLCAIDGQDLVDQQESGKQHLLHQSAKKLLCQTVHNMEPYFQKINQGAEEATLREAFLRIKYAVDTDLMLLLDHLQNKDTSRAMHIVQLTMPENLDFYRLNGHLKEILTKLKATELKKQFVEDAPVLACICVHTMNLQNELFMKSNAVTAAERQFPWALVRLSICLWVYSALGVDGLVPIAETATSFISWNHQQQKKERVESSAKGMGAEDEQQQNDREAGRRRRSEKPFNSWQEVANEFWKEGAKFFS